MLEFLEMESAQLDPGSTPWIKAQIGEVGALTIMLMQARMAEQMRGEPPGGLTRLGPDMMSCLIRWKLDYRLVERKINVDKVIRQRTPKVLRQLCPALSDERIEEMINDMLEMVAKIIRQHVN